MYDNKMQRYADISKKRICKPSHLHYIAEGKKETQRHDDVNNNVYISWAYIYTSENEEKKVYTDSLIITANKRYCRKYRIHSTGKNG
jgi:hypothetical protein